MGNKCPWENGLFVGTAIPLKHGYTWNTMIVDHHVPLFEVFVLSWPLPYICVVPIIGHGCNIAAKLQFNCIPGCGCCQLWCSSRNRQGGGRPGRISLRSKVWQERVGAAILTTLRVHTASTGAFGSFVRCSASHSFASDCGRTRSWLSLRRSLGLGPSRGCGLFAFLCLCFFALLLLCLIHFGLFGFAFMLFLWVVIQSCLFFLCVFRFVWLSGFCEASHCWNPSAVAPSPMLSAASVCVSSFCGYHLDLITSCPSSPSPTGWCFVIILYTLKSIDWWISQYKMRWNGMKLDGTRYRQTTDASRMAVQAASWHVPPPPPQAQGPARTARGMEQLTKHWQVGCFGFKHVFQTSVLNLENGWNWEVGFCWFQRSVLLSIYNGMTGLLFDESVASNRLRFNQHQDLYPNWGDQPVIASQEKAEALGVAAGKHLQEKNPADKTKWHGKHRCFLLCALGKTWLDWYFLRYELWEKTENCC